MMTSFEHLTKLGLLRNTSALHSVQSLHLCLLSELVRLWDLLIAFGPYLNVLRLSDKFTPNAWNLTVETANECQLILNSTASPLHAAQIIRMTMTIQPSYQQTGTFTTNPAPLSIRRTLLRSFNDPSIPSIRWICRRQRAEKTDAFAAEEKQDVQAPRCAQCRPGRRSFRRRTFT